MSPCVCSSQFNHNRTNLNRSFPLNTMIRRQSLGKEPIKSLTAAHRASLRANDPDVLNAAYAVQQEQAETEKVPETANNESKQFKRSLSASIPPFSRQLVFTSMDFIFEEEVWENESWKTVRRIWSSPMLGVPNYAKRGNETLRLPDDKWREYFQSGAGWEWTSEINIDISGRFGTADKEGWFYGPSFEVLLDQIKRKKGVDQNSSSTARRRRWLKSKKCVSPELLEVFRQKFVSIKEEAEKLKKSARNRAKNNVAIEFYEKRRVQAYQWSSTLAANKCIELVVIFKEFRDKLSNLKEFLEERISIDSEYATRLRQWSEKWRSKASSIQSDGTDDDDMNPGVIQILSSTGGFVASNTSTFTSSVSLSILPELDSILLEVRKCIDSGTKDISALWSMLTEREAAVSREYVSYKNNFKVSLEKTTEEVIALTECFVAASSVGFINVETLLKADAVRTGTVFTEDVLLTSYNISLPTSVFSDLSALREVPPDPYQFYQRYCSAVVSAKNILTDMETLVSVLNESAQAIAKRCATLMKVMADTYTESFIKQYELSIERMLAVTSKLQLIYAADEMNKSKSSTVATNNTSDSTLAEYPETMVTGETGESTRVLSSPEQNPEEVGSGDDSEIIELERKLEETEGEFDFTAVPPLMTSVLKAGLLHVCSPEELSRGAMCRWDPIGAVLTELTLMLHPLNDEQKNAVTSLSGESTMDIEICKIVLGIPPSHALPLSKMRCSLLLHPVFSDAFEIVVSGAKFIFLTPSTKATSEWLDAISAPATVPELDYSSAVHEHAFSA